MKNGPSGSRQSDDLAVLDVSLLERFGALIDEVMLLAI
jgi:hypothetical protein